MGINRVTISGRLTNDPQLRSTQSGMAILSFSIAVNDRKKNPQTGEWEDVAGFYDCTMFGTRAEKLAQYLTKGTKVAVEGKLHYSSWEKDGNRRSKVDVTVDEIEFMTPKATESASKPQQEQEPSSYVYDEDIPF